MMKSLHSKMALLGICMLMQAFHASSQAYSESFDNVGLLAGSGWFIQNNSSPLGPNSWYQGVPTTATPDPGPFNAFNGADNAYIAANFASTTGGSGTISNWLVTPNRTLRNGDVFTFYTRKPTIGAGQTDFPDRLEVRLSTNGASTNVGSTAAAFGDFSTLLLSINPSLTTNVYPQVWTQFTITISGLPAPTSGRIAFRYFVTNGGPSGSNSDYIGVDQVNYTPYVCPTLTVSPTTLTGGSAGTAYSASLSQTGALGAPGYAVTAGALPPGVTLSAGGNISGTPTATGTFNFTVTVSDASGCAGSRPYSITIVCPANPVSFPTPSPLCSNDSPVTLTNASPAGGTYSGTGVSGGQFDPAAGTQTVTYDYTDPYGCAFSSNATYTVNTQPTVTQSAVAAVCADASPITLTGGSPAGGTYSGNGVSAGQFDPAVGTQTLTYQYTDANGCSAEATFDVTVNTLPTVTQSAVAAVCADASPITLTGGSPAGGTYSGTGVSAGQFDPASGTQTLAYEYTDANGCSAEATFDVTVNALPAVTQNTPFGVCADAEPFALTGGSPAGGTYSGTGVTAGQFDPASGTQTITYEYTDANGCSNVATFAVSVHPLPTVTFTLPATICTSAAPLTLIGTPSGGTFTGNGVSGAVFTPSAAGIGSVTITYNYTDGLTCQNSAQATINVSSCAGTEENELANAVNVYPNPTTGMLNVSFAGFGGDTDIEIVNVQGKRIYGSQVSATDTFTQTLDISTFANGVYYLRISGKAGVVVKTLVKQ